MRTHLLAALVLITACSVPDKHAAETDGGVDSPGQSGGELDTTITDAPAEFSNQSTALFKFTSSRAGATFTCSVDGDSPTPCQSPFSRALNDGTHNFSVRAIDASGESDHTPAEHVWTIDTAAPDTKLVKTPPAADNSELVRFGFVSTEDNVVFDCSLDSAPFAPCDSDAQLGPITDGAHAFTVRARDRAGNVDPSPAVFAWTVDTSTPDTQLLSGPMGASGSQTASFTFFSPDAGSGATFQCTLDGGAASVCTSPKMISGLTEGMHTFTVRVRDAVGNLDPTPATRTWTVDLTPPDTTIASGPTGTVAVASAAFTFTSNEMGVTYTCSLDGGAYSPCTSPHSLPGLAQGPHTFSVKATDPAGHDDPTPATRSWTVDTVAPNLVITAGPANNGTSGPRVTFAFTVDEGMVACSLDAAPFTACTSPVAFNAPAGPHQFRVRATDAAGNVTTAMRAWTIACAAPDAMGAAGLLHLDDPGQTQTNAVPAGAPATLGDTAMAEPGDPTPQAAGRFGGDLAFNAATSTHVSWPAALGPSPTVAVELWARPDAAAGARDVLVTGDGRFAIRVAMQGAGTVTFSASGLQGTTVITATSAPVAAGAWHHIAVNLAPPSLSLWVDGVRTDAAITAGTPPALDAIRLGGDATTAYSGQLDEIWVAQSAFASDEAVLARYCPL